MMELCLLHFHPWLALCSLRYQKQRRLCEFVIIKHVGLNGFECLPSLPLSAQGYTAVSEYRSFAALMQSNTLNKTLQQWRFPKTFFKNVDGNIVALQRHNSTFLKLLAVLQIRNLCNQFSFARF